MYHHVYGNISIRRSESDLMYTVRQGDVTHPRLNLDDAARLVGQMIIMALEDRMQTTVTPTSPLSIDASITPYVQRIRDSLDEEGDGLLPSFLMDGNCACTGLQGRDPLCPCAMTAIAAHIVARERSIVLPSTVSVHRKPAR